MTKYFTQCSAFITKWVLTIKNRGLVFGMVRID